MPTKKTNAGKVNQAGKDPFAFSSIKNPHPEQRERPDDSPPMPEVADTGSSRVSSIQTVNLNTLGNIVIPPPILYSLDEGCYFTKFQPTGTSYKYFGSIRVQRASATNRIASGDLYYYKPPIVVWPFPVGSTEPKPANGIPVLSRKDYRYYLRITQILEGISASSKFTLGYEMWRFNGTGSNPLWTKEGNFTADMAFGSAPAGYPSGADYLTGPVRNAGGSVVGTLEMGWVSKYLRKATVEIDRVSVSESPVDSGAGHTWQSVFDSVGWEMKIIQSNNNVSEPSGNSWSDAEMHAAMLLRRDSADLDSEWRYHILAVRNIDSTPRGIMYDAYGTDSNNVPREGIGIASHWTIPNTSEWGSVKGMRFGLAKAPYFRTALHEIGHAMGLYHNTIDMGIMNTTDVIAGSGTVANPFPGNIKWQHASDDQKRLRHMPDIYVRPGGLPFGGAYSANPISPDDAIESATGIQLSLNAVMDVVPIGAPVRLEMSMQNVEKYPLPVPSSLDMKYGCVKGTVTDPSGTVRHFIPIILCVDEVPLVDLKPGDAIDGAMTLLRGGEGALFPYAGAYSIMVKVEWELGDGHVGVAAETEVYVTQAKDDNHARAALRILRTPDTLLSLVMAGDHLKEGNDAINQAMENPVLRPHYAYIEAKRLSKRFMDRDPDLSAASKLVDKNTVMNSQESKKAAKFKGK